MLGIAWSGSPSI